MSLLSEFQVIWNRGENPINLLDDHEHRWSHALAFGATASIIFDLFSGDYTSLYVKTGEVEPWLKIFLGAVATVELGTVLFPFFACISSPSLFVGSLLGFVYVAIWFSVQLSHIITCPNIDGGKGFPYESVIIQLPVLIFTFLLMIRFLYFLIISIMKKIQHTKISSEEKLMQSYQAQHVQALLRPPLPPRWTKDELNRPNDVTWLYPLSASLPSCLVGPTDLNRSLLGPNFPKALDISTSSQQRGRFLQTLTDAKVLLG
nr:stimulated by retinoic acid gene 6 protein-like [Lytechinus pictus]